MIVNDCKYIYYMAVKVWLNDLLDEFKLADRRFITLKLNRYTLFVLRSVPRLCIGAYRFNVLIQRSLVDLYNLGQIADVDMMEPFTTIFSRLYCIYFIFMYIFLK